VVCGFASFGRYRLAYRDTEAIDSPLEDFTAAGPREILVQERTLDAARALLDDSAD